MKIFYLFISIFMISVVSCSSPNEEKTTIPEKKMPSKDNVEYAKMGKKMALASKAILGKNLMGAIKKNGTAGALSFCNVKAIALTDSMSILHNAKIRRVSDLYRNNVNAAKGEELIFINKTKALLAQGKPLKPHIINNDDSDIVTGYYPIVTNKKCLQCHGTPQKQIKSEVMTLITSLYPEDKAIGYKENELRGIWVIDMKK